MAINKEDNKRFLVTMSKIDYSTLEKLAKEDNRSVSNYVKTLILQKIKEIEN